MSTSPPRQQPSLPRRALAVLAAIAFTELLLRGALWLFAHVSHPNCGLRPELLGRLIYAYSHDRPSPSAPSIDGMVPDEHRGYRHAPNLRAQMLHGAVISTNSRGMRGAREYSMPRPPGVVRVVAIGDSFTLSIVISANLRWA